MEDVINGIIEQPECIKEINLIGMGIDFDGICALCEVLTTSQVVSLNLANNSIQCNGLIRLAKVLNDTQITTLNIENNGILDEGVVFLADILKRNTRLTYLDLSGNKINPLAARSLNSVKCAISLDVYFTINDYISQRSCSVRNKYNITLRGNRIGTYAAQYLNITLRRTGINVLVLDDNVLHQSDVEFLAIAFTNIKILNFKMRYSHLTQFSGVEYLTAIFMNSHIVKLEVCESKLGNAATLHLVEFLKSVKVFNLYLRNNFIGDQGIIYLSESLINNDVMCINLAWNRITCEGVRHLCKVLKHTKIMFLNFSFNQIGVNGVRYLADGLPGSQVIHINLDGNSIHYEAYQYLVNAVDRTNLSSVTLHFHKMGAILGQESNNIELPRGKPSVASDLRRAFLELISDEFEFKIPPKTMIGLDQYGFLIRNLNYQPNTKVHIYDMLCKHKVGDGPVTDWDFNMIRDINAFIPKMVDKFMELVENKLPILVKSFGITGDNFVKLVKEFHEMGLDKVVQNLLLHRVLYDVDDNHEILHPFIYKMLHIHNMPLYNEQLEPNKKSSIISYFKEHQEIDGAQEIIGLLESESD